MNAPLFVLDNSNITTSTQPGRGGDIAIQAGQLIRTPDSVVRASGAITIAAPDTDVSSSLVVLPGTFLDAGSRLRVACAARGGRPTSSLSPAGPRRPAGRPSLRTAADAAGRH